MEPKMYFSHYSHSERFPGSWISEGAKIESGNIILPGCAIGDSVIIGPNNVVGPNVVIEGGVQIGVGNLFMPGVTIGMPSRQRIRFKESPALPSQVPLVLIGNGNILHEGVTVRLPMKESTIIEDRVVIGAKTHVANDCLLRRDVLIAANCSLGGYVSVGAAASLGLGVTIHPRTAIGAYAMCGLSGGITKHVAPGATVGGVPAKYLQPNIRGLKRNGFTLSQIELFCLVLEGKAMPNTDSRIYEAFQEFAGDVRRWGRSANVLPSTAFELQRER